MGFNLAFKGLTDHISNMFRLLYKAIFRLQLKRRFLIFVQLVVSLKYKIQQNMSLMWYFDYLLIIRYVYYEHANFFHYLKQNPVPQLKIIGSSEFYVLCIGVCVYIYQCLRGSCWYHLIVNIGM